MSEVILGQLLRILCSVLRRRPQRAHVSFLILERNKVILAGLLRISRPFIVLHDLLLSILLLFSCLPPRRSHRLLRLF